MKLASAPVRSLVPTQLNIDLYRMEEISFRFNSRLFEPISVVADGDDFLIADGHHRASLFYLLGFDSAGALDIPMMILENDGDMRRYCRNGRAMKNMGDFKLGFTLRDKVARRGLPGKIEAMPLWVYQMNVPLNGLGVINSEVYCRIDGNDEVILQLPMRSDVESAIDRYSLNASAN